MNARVYEFPESKKWQQCYKAAIVEADSTKLPDRIAEAKKVIGQRARDVRDNRKQLRGRASSRRRNVRVACSSGHVEVSTDRGAANAQRSENGHELKHLKMD